MGGRSILVLLPLLLLALAGRAAASVPWRCTATTTRENYDYTQGLVLGTYTSSSPDHCRAVCCSVVACNTWVLKQHAKPLPLPLPPMCSRPFPGCRDQCTVKLSTVGGTASPGVTSGMIAKDYGTRNRTLAGYVGCWGDNNDRDLPYYPSNLMYTNAECVELCASLPSAFAGTEWRGECRCGDVYGRYPALFPCSSPCDKNTSEMCGGWWVNSVYSTGYAAVDKAACMPVPAFQATAFTVPVETNAPTLHARRPPTALALASAPTGAPSAPQWEWDVSEWNPFCWGYQFVFTVMRGAATDYTLKAWSRFHTGPFPFHMRQWGNWSIDPGVYNVTMTYNSIRAGDVPKSAKTAVCVPSFPAAAALLGPPDGDFDDDVNGTVTFRWAALNASQWNATVLCGHSFAPTYDVFVGLSPANLSLVAQVAGTNYTTHLPSALYYWNVLPNNGVRLAFGLSDPTHRPRALTVHIPVCGDGLVAGAEECDGGEGCANCTCARGFYARATPGASCETRCGDGVVSGAEECETASDTCSPNCTCRHAGHVRDPQGSLGCVDPCAHWASCRLCLYSAGCGWCQGSASCMASPGGDAPALCAAGWAAASCPADGSQSPAGAIVGGVVGGVAGVSLLAGLLLAAVWHRTRRQRPEEAVYLARTVSCTEFLVNAMEIKMIRAIGRGSYGVVYRHVLLSDALSADSVEQFDKEVSVMRALRHPNVLLFMCYAKSDKELIIVTEFMPTGSMMDLFAHRPPGITLRKRVGMLLDVCKGMSYLHYHEPQIIHCDLKSGNVLLDNNLTAKVCDFGLTVFLDKDTSKSSSKSKDSSIGSLFWTAPEVLTGAPCSTKSDVYSFGIIAWEAVTQEVPYVDMNPHYVAQMVMGFQLRPEVSDKFPKPLLALMESCWDYNPLVRPEFPQLVSDWPAMAEEMEPYFKADEAQLVYVEPPSGLVAFVFTGTSPPPDPSACNRRRRFCAATLADIQGSTHLWEWNASVMKKALLRHNDIVRECYRKHSGYEVKTEGDAFMLTFQSPLDALRFCCDAQKALLAEPWDPRLLSQDCCAEAVCGETVLYKGLRVRMGIHIGVPEVVTSATSKSVDYLGPCVNKAARVSGLAVGGQITVSHAATMELGKEPEAVAALGRFEEVGAVPLKGIQGEEIIHSFAIAGLPREFGRLSKSAVLNPVDPSTNVAGATNEENRSDVLCLGIAPSKQATSPDVDDILERLTKQVKHKWSVDPSEVNISDVQLGRGNFGTVYKGEWRGQTVCVKKFFQQKVDKVTLGEVERQLKEIAILTELRHPSIVLFMGACIEPNNMFILSEWMDMGSLRQVLSSQKIEFTLGTQILTSVCQGMIYLHMSGIIHRDLKSSNILLNKKWDVKLADFGLAAVKSTNKTMTVCGTVAWMAPEVLVWSQYSEKSDVFGYGMVMYEVLTRELPYATTPTMALVPKIVSGQRPPVPADLQGFSAEYVDLMKRCWADKQEDRPAFREALEHLRAIAADTAARVPCTTRT
eukprot:m51a1_g10148 putative serine threonine kinase (1495) ;mRNA; f:85313-90906